MPQNRTIPSGRLEAIEARLTALEVEVMRLRAPSGITPDRWDGDWSKLPPTLNARHIAAIEDVSVDTIYDRIQKRTMQPKPLRWWKPYRWLRDQVRAELERQ